MAINTQLKNDDADLQERNIVLREDLSNAYASILGEQSAKSFHAFTFEEALDSQIAKIEGPSTKQRPNLLDRVDRIVNNLVKAVDQIKALPPEQFREPKPSEDVNSPEGSTTEV